MRRLLMLGIAFAACEKAGDGRKTVELELPELTVTLIDAGAEPRAPLRYHFEPGATATYERTFDQTLHRGSQTDHKAPRRERMDTRVVAVEPDGSFQEHTRMGDVELDGRHDARGRLASMVATYPPGDKTPSSHRAYEHTMTFPDEPVGPGARWRFVAVRGTDRATVDASLISVQGHEIEVRTSYVSSYTLDGGREQDAIGTVDWHIDLTGSRSTMHAQERVTPANDPTVWAERTVDVVPVR